jgi:hypothetical protein
MSFLLISIVYNTYVFLLAAVELLEFRSLECRCFAGLGLGLGSLQKEDVREGLDWKHKSASVDLCLQK